MSRISLYICTTLSEPALHAHTKNELVSGHIRVLNKRASLKIIFLISQSKHMLWVCKRIVSMSTQNVY